jgi:hypothetical protein
MNTPSQQEIEQHYWKHEYPHPDPKDATIAALAKEVERLAGDLATAASRLEGEGYGGKRARQSALAGTALLHRLGLAGDSRA